MRLRPGQLAFGIVGALVACRGSELLPAPADQATKSERALTRGAAAPELARLYEIALGRAIRRDAPVSGKTPTTICVDLGAPDPPVRGYPTGADLMGLRREGLSVQGGSLECLHAAGPPAAYLSPCLPQRWWDEPDVYEIAFVAIYKTGVSADENVRLLVVAATYRRGEWVIVRERFEDLPPDAYAASRRTMA